METIKLDKNSIFPLAFSPTMMMQLPWLRNPNSIFLAKILIATPKEYELFVNEESNDLR